MAGGGWGWGWEEEGGGAKGVRPSRTYFTYRTESNITYPNPANSHSAAAASATMEVDSGKAAAGAEIDLSKLPADFAGTYELISVVTHKGRDSSSGHYIGYAKDLPKAEAMKRAEAAGKGAVGGKKKKKKPEPWLKFDDDVVYESDWDEVKLLCGGGDREMVYLAFYRAVGEEV